MTGSKRGSTRTGLPAALPDGEYDPPSLVEESLSELVVAVRFHGEDGRSRTLPVDQLPLSGWHSALAGALAARVGPAGGLRTETSAKHAWGALARVVRFLGSLPEPPAEPSRLCVEHLTAFLEQPFGAGSEATRKQDLREFRLLVAEQPLCMQVPADVVDFLNRRGQSVKLATQPGYSDREFGSLVQAARSDVANIRDRIRAGESLLARYREDAERLRADECERARLLDLAGGTGAVPWIPGSTVNWTGRRLAVARELFLVTADMPALLALFVVVAERNVETIKELSVEHRVLEGRAVELSVVKRRRGQKRWHETVAWEIGKPGRELHTPGGLYLLIHELTARSRAFSGTRSLWSVWRNGHNIGVTGKDEHRGMFDQKLHVNLYASEWAEEHGLTADQPTSPRRDTPASQEDEENGEGRARMVKVGNRWLRRKVRPETLLVDFGRLKTSVEVRRTKQMGGHLPSSVRTNTIPVLFSNYLRGDPTVVEWAEEVVGEALADAERSALAAHRRALRATGSALRVIAGPTDAQHLQQAGLDADVARKAAAGDLTTAWTECVDHDHHPVTGDSCRASFLDCFQCGNCLITRNDLPRLLGLLDALALRRQQMSEDDWWGGRYGMAWVAIGQDVLAKFSPAEIAQAEAVKPEDTLLDLVEYPWEQP